MVEPIGEGKPGFSQPTSSANAVALKLLRSEQSAQSGLFQETDSVTPGCDDADPSRR
jgi:hypothetical protein